MSLGISTASISFTSSNAGMKAIFDALNIIYDEEEKRGLIRLNLLSLFFTICAVAGAGLAVTLVVVFPLFLATFGVTSSDHPIVAYLRWPADEGPCGIAAVCTTSSRSRREWYARLKKHDVMNAGGLYVLGSGWTAIGVIVCRNFGWSSLPHFGVLRHPHDHRRSQGQGRERS